ncbi:MULTISPECIES: GNAT family N-acetyltransferase [unclassified Acinetobacter]|uniref:GNAT family N-acetyltransferase n=1 Tax=unclassified Acinetobacter TaxID=196816 RepID=UPI0018AC10E1|nr:MULTISPECIES: GNAT family N-acetyltransferase [unclassified Acinetobacter]MBJ9953428.1 GNAT family N-acetyltransferase [Acinetobacter baumannii]
MKDMRRASLDLHSISAREVNETDWSWILDWFKDPILDKELGPMDEEWLNYVLNKQDGPELVVMSDNQPIALVGCVWSLTNDGLHSISDLAVHPAYRGCGIGKSAVECLFKWPNHPPSKGWQAFVALENKSAQSFFIGIGWDMKGIDEDMYVFSFIHK